MRATRLLPLVSALLVIGVSAVAAEAPTDLEVARAASAGERPNVIITYRAGPKSRLRTYFEKDVIRGAFPKRDGGRPEGSQRPRSGAASRHPEVAPYSSRGRTWYDGYMKPDLVAPGHALVAISDPSTTPYRNAALRAGVAPYLKLNGTSMAAAVATGVAALVLQANRFDLGSPALTPNTVKALLQCTSIPVADDGIGWGDNIVWGDNVVWGDVAATSVAR